MTKDQNIRVLIVIAAVIALSLIGVGAIVGLLALRAGTVADSTPLVTAILGFLAPTIISLLTLVRLERNTEITQETQRDVKEVKQNGH